MRKYLISLFLFSMVIVASGYLALSNTDRIENEVVFTLINHAKEEGSMSDVALYSYPSDCGINIDSLEGIESSLVKSFRLSNELARGPIRLNKLEGFFNLLSWSDNLQLYDTKKMSLKFRASSKQLVQVSRVGFSSDGKQALVCLMSSVSGNIYILEQINGSWRYSKQLNGWIS